jgi:hypothetical protein
MPNNHLSPDLLASIAAEDGEDPPHAAECSVCRADLDAMRNLVSDLRILPDPPVRLIEAAKSYFRRRRLLDDLIGRLIEDPALRAKASAKPEAVLREAGLEQTPELIEVIRDPGRDPSEVARRLAAKSLWL